LQRQVHRDRAFFLPGKRIIKVVMPGDQSAIALRAMDADVIVSAMHLSATATAGALNRRGITTASSKRWQAIQIIRPASASTFDRPGVLFSGVRVSARGRGCAPRVLCRKRWFAVP